MLACGYIRPILAFFGLNIGYRPALCLKCLKEILVRVAWADGRFCCCCPHLKEIICQCNFGETFFQFKMLRYGILGQSIGCFNPRILVSAFKNPFRLNPIDNSPLEHAGLSLPLCLVVQKACITCVWYFLRYVRSTQHQWWCCANCGQGDSARRVRTGSERGAAHFQDFGMGPTHSVLRAALPTAITMERPDVRRDRVRRQHCKRPYRPQEVWTTFNWPIRLPQITYVCMLSVAHLQDPHSKEFSQGTIHVTYKLLPPMSAKCRPI